MARNFGVTNPTYLEALEEIRKVKLPDIYWLGLMNKLNTKLENKQEPIEIIFTI